jgi:formylglycine-generating enzyme required for sulfatase activity
MAYESGYEIIVGVRLIPSRASAHIVGSATLPWGKVLGEANKGCPSIFMLESHRIPSQRQAFQGLAEVVPPFASPSTLRQVQDSAELRRCPEFTEGTRLRTLPVKSFEPEMVLIPAGEFTIGSDASLDQDAIDGERPSHTLYLPDYYLAKTPVTNAQYAAFVQATGYHLPERWIGGQPPAGKGNHPVVYVSWHDAMAYCNWLAEETGKPYCLPSEVEWEKGARGSDRQTYLQGASPYDLLEMAGNVWEWTRSVYEVYPCDPGDGLEDIKSGVSRMLRGGSWYGNQWYARCTLRYGVFPDARYHYIGFRVTASPGSR